MLHRVIGTAGSGKTEYILTELGNAMKAGTRCILIVPEQQSVATEQLICDRFGDKSNLLCEVLNFERLPNRIAREYGGLAVENIDKGGACALLSVTAESVADSLTEYRTVAGDPDFAERLLSLINRMKMALITPEMLLQYADNFIIAENRRLASKLRDIALIYSEYEKDFGDGLFDPRDALTRLAAELESKPFFKDAFVFIDGYYTFTNQEYAVIREVILQSKQTYVSFTIDENRGFFSENADSAERVKKLSKKGCEDYYTGFSKRAGSKALAHLEKNLWGESVVTLNGDDGSVRLFAAENRFDETEAAASEILAFVREGGRFREIALLCRNTDAYEGIVETVFAKSEIPVYMSKRDELLTKPLFALVCSALNIVLDNFSCRSVKRYIKCGFTDLTTAETDILISYAESWNIRGKSWYSGEEWAMNPEGYREGGLSPRGEKLLAVANRARNKLLSSLGSLHDTLSSKELTVTKGLRAIYDHLIDCRTDEKLRIIAEEQLNSGNREESERTVQLWKLLIGVFDRLHTVCGERTVTIKRLLSLFKLVSGCYSLGAIPASSDAVTFGDASLIRAGNCKMVLVLGVCDGEFPAAISHGCFFDKTEASLLEDADCAIADTSEKLLDTERFLVYSALTAPSKRLVLLHPENELGGGELRPSSAISAVAKLLPDITEKRFTESDMMFSRGGIASFFPMLENGSMKESIRETLEGFGTSFFEAEPEICEKVSRITVKDKKLSLSPSKFERYCLCPFSFFGKYLLFLQEKKKNDFAAPEVGNFIHKILEQYMRECVKSGTFVRPDEASSALLVESLAKKYFLDISGTETENDSRFMLTYERLIKTLLLVTDNLCSEFEESEFVPKEFEFRIGLKNADAPAIEYDVDGKTVLLRGAIDRVDTFYKDGMTYVRVVDYKTYNKVFSATLLDLGLDTQLLHYLFAYCDSKKNHSPAGALYYEVKLPYTGDTSESDEEIKASLYKSLTRDGLLLDNPEIVLAMSKSCEFVPVKLKKDGTLYSGRNLLRSEEDFTELKEKLQQQIIELARNVFDGYMDIAPKTVSGKVDACKNCRLAPICRNKGGKEELTNEIHTIAE